MFLSKDAKAELHRVKTQSEFWKDLNEDSLATVCQWILFGSFQRNR
jgi:hypothetical protein